MSPIIAEQVNTAFDELETRQRGPSPVLRSKTPDAVIQEVYGNLYVHHAMRRLYVPPQWISATTRIDYGHPVHCGPLGALLPATRVFPTH